MIQTSDKGELQEFVEALIYEVSKKFGSKNSAGAIFFNLKKSYDNSENRGIFYKMEYKFF